MKSFFVRGRWGNDGLWCAQQLKKCISRLICVENLDRNGNWSLILHILQVVKYVLSSCKTAFLHKGVSDSQNKVK